MNKKFSRVIAVILALMMLVSASPVSLIASAEIIDFDAADYLTFNVTNGGNVSAGTSVTLYSRSTVVASATTNANGVVEFIPLTEEQCETITKAVVGSVTINGPFDMHTMYFVDLKDKTLIDPNLTVDVSSYSLEYGEEVSISASSDSSADVVYSSSNPAVVTVDENGNIKTTGVGNATIEAYVAASGDYSDGSASVTVDVAPSNNAIVKFAMVDIADAVMGTTYQNPAILAPDAKGVVSYTSSNESYARVESNGDVTVIGDGDSAVITATFTPDADCKEYESVSLSYTISSSFTVNWNYNATWVNSGEIVVTANSRVEFTVNGEGRYIAKDGKINVGLKEIPEGKNEIIIFVGNARTTKSIWKDTTAPDFEIDNKKSNDWVKSADVKIVDFTDENDGIDVSGIDNFTYSGTDFTGTITNLSGEVLTLDNSLITDGVHTVTVTATDKAGNSTSKTTTISKDSTGDTADIKYNGAWITDNSQEIDVVITNNKQKSSPITDVKIFSDGKAISNAVKKADAELSYKIDLSKLDLAEGANTFTIQVTDEAGNVSNKLTYTDSEDKKVNATSFVVNFDSVAPEFTIDSYTENNGWFVSPDEKVTISGISDANGSGVQSLYYYVNGNDAEKYEVTETIGEAENTKKAISLDDLKFENGICDLTVIAIDNAGNISEKTATIKFDNTAPVIGSFAFNQVGSDTVSKTANKLTYGQFFNEGIKVTVEISDDESGVAKEDLVLTAIPEADETASVEFSAKSYDEDSKTAEFLITADAFTENPETELIFKGTVSVDAKNNAGLSDSAYATGENSENHTLITWEVVPPIVAIEMPDPEYTAEDGTEWYGDKFDANVSYSDTHSGVKSVVINVNDSNVFSYPMSANDSALLEKTDIIVQFDGKTTKGGFIVVKILDENDNVIRTSEVPVNLSCEYNLSVTVTDEAGNVTTESVEFLATTYALEQFEQIGPKVLYNLPQSDPENGVIRYDDTENNITWYSSDIEFDVVVYDPIIDDDSRTASGIKDVSVKVNGVGIGDDEPWGDDPAKITARTFKADTKTIDAKNGNGTKYKYDINVQAKDNADNELTSSKSFYIDNIAPVVMGFNFAMSESKNDTMENVLRALTFGYFFNSEVTITVNASDVVETGKGIEKCSGIGEYVLFINGEEYARNTSGEFTVSEFDYEKAEISAQVIDNVGNVSDVVSSDEVLTVEKEAPAVSISAPDKAFTNADNKGVVRYPAEGKAADGKVWYSDNFDFTVNVADAASGLESVRLFVNNYCVVSDIYGVNGAELVTSKTYTLSTKNIAPLSDGSYNVLYECIDNAGNVSTNMTDSQRQNISYKDGENVIYVEKDSYVNGLECTAAEYPATAYIDNITPGLKHIDFLENKDNQNVSVTYNGESNRYDIVCDKGTAITVTVSDSGASSGIKNIVVNFINVSGEKITPDGTFKEDVNNAGTYTWQYTFTDNFKGSMSVEITDNVNNYTDIANPANFINESSALHNQEKDHISIELDGYSDGAYFNQAVTPVIHFKDEYAGIGSVEVDVTADNGYNEKYVVSNISSDSYADPSVSEDETDMNHVTKASMKIPVAFESDNIKIAVKMTDNAGNTSDANYLFTTDFTAPVITCTLSSAATPINRYYSSAVTASFTVTEHHFDPNLVSLTEGSLSGWSNNGDVHTNSAVYAGEGAHQFNMTVTDKAGNQTTINASEGTFYVDNTDPSITVSNMSHNQATNSEDVSFTITASDALCLASNPLTTTFSVWYKEDNARLVNDTFSLSELEAMNFITVVPSAGSTQYAYNIDLTNAKDVFNDGIYAFTCGVTDMSGRTSNTIICQTEENTSASVSEFMFSLNRTGSTYMVKWAGDSANISDLKNVDGDVTNNPADIIIQEINPTEIDTEAVGTKITIYDGIESKTVDVTATPDTSSKYSIYTYTIPRSEYFKNDGIYELSMETVDAAGNVSDGANKNFKAAAFTIDTTAPAIKSDLDNDLVISATSHRFSISVEDLTSCVVDVLVNGTPATVYLSDAADAEPVTASNLKLDSTTKQIYIDLEGSVDTVEIKAADVLNQEQTVSFQDITISTNGLVRLFARLNSMPWIYIIIVGVPVLVAALFIIIAKKRKGDDFKDEKKSKKGKK